MEVKWVSEDDRKILELNKEAQKPEFQDVELVLGEPSLGDDFTGDKDAVSKQLSEKVRKGLMDTYDELWSGDANRLSVMPVESFLPMIFLRYVVGFSKTKDINSENINFGFEPEMILDTVRPRPPKKASMMKEIHSEFSVPEEGGDPKFIQLIADENAINTFILDFVLVERAFSLRNVMRSDKRFAEVLRQMTSDNIALLLPEFGEEFGPGRAIDFYFSLSHSLIANKLDNAKASGFQMDKNGNFRFVFNFSTTLLVEKKGVRAEWEEARSIFISLVAKGKFVVDEHADGKRYLKLTPKMGEISDIKILNGKDEP